MEPKTRVALTGFVGKVIESLGDLVLEVHACDARRGFVRIDPARVKESAKRMWEVEGSRLATCTAIDVRDGIDVLYHWAIEPAGVVVTLKALAARPAMELDSIANEIPAANWIEREMHDLLGANFIGHPDMRRLILADSWPEGVYPLRKDFDQVLDRPPHPENQSSPDVLPEGGSKS
ncbi:MAG TPA: NADH-quinone oxidoreductase subunit C [Planctomycetota bacterium]|nr:NADH-quinone oxidoreductase subunit C [Planctomycetota bacterium]